ncbi:MAG: site-specific integrase [Cyclobacteriaceae bacterium]
MKNLSILFYHYRSKVNSKGLAPIYLRITINGKQAQASTGCSIELTLWDSSKGKVKGRNPSATFINNKLDNFRSEINDIVYKLEKEQKVVSSKRVISILKGEDKENMSLLELFNYQIDRMKNLPGKYEQSTIEKFAIVQKRVELFLSEHMSQEDIFLSELKRGFIKDYEYFASQKLQQITINKEIQRIKQILYVAEENDWIVKNPFRGYKPSQAKTKIVFLQPDELDRIENKVFDLDRLDLIRDFFVFSCYTGLGYAEAANLTPNDLTLPVDGFRWIDSTRIKTDRQFKVPILPKAEKIINKYSSHPLVVNRGTVLPIYSNQKVNSYLKEIADLCRVSKNLTHHVARKTFASTVLLLNDVPMDIVSKALGHSNTATTQKYYAQIMDQGMSRHFTKLRDTLSQTDNPINLKPIKNND